MYATVMLSQARKLASRRIANRNKRGVSMRRFFRCDRGRIEVAQALLSFRKF